MNGDINIDIGGALLPLIDRIASFFGQDEYSKGMRLRLAQRLQRSLEDSKSILIASMDREVPLEQIYQPLRLSPGGTNSTKFITTDQLINGLEASAILLAGPGGGKSVTLRHACSHLGGSKTRVPLLFLLKEPVARKELNEILDALKARRSAVIGKTELILLLDGYDEITYEERVALSITLRELNSIKDVRFILTCRLYYDIVDLPVRRYYLQPFTDYDSLSFLKAFLALRESPVSAQELLDLMNERGFSEYFIHNPLLLALTAILQTGESPQVPRDAVKLLTYVVSFLSFQWDRIRGVNRESLPDLDGDDLLKCLMRVAAKFESLERDQSIAEAAIKEHLDLKQADAIDPFRVLTEMACWFGFIVQTELRTWSFVHAAIQDFLAAKFMVESGAFGPNEARRNWRRAHYAACLMPDATEYICQALRNDVLEMFVECCANNASFNSVKVANSLVDFYQKTRDGCVFVHNESQNEVFVTLEQDFLQFVKTPFLRTWVDQAMHSGKDRKEQLISLALALSELQKREVRLPRFVFSHYSDIRWAVKRPGLGKGKVLFSSREISRGRG